MLPVVVVVVVVVGVVVLCHVWSCVVPSPVLVMLVVTVAVVGCCSTSVVAAMCVVGRAMLLVVVDGVVSWIPVGRRCRGRNSNLDVRRCELLRSCSLVEVVLVVMVRRASLVACRWSRWLWLGVVSLVVGECCAWSCAVLVPVLSVIVVVDVLVVVVAVVDVRC